MFAMIHQSFARVGISLVTVFMLKTAVQAQQPSITNLQCEHLVTPIGIDNANPRFTWRLESTASGLAQNQYTILVGTDSAALARGEGKTWNSGAIKAATNLAVYKGAALEPFQKYYWRVKLQTNKNTWVNSPVSSFETGMMDMRNWKGSWISDNHGIHTKPAPYFRKQFATGKTVRSARAYVAAGGLYELYINGNRIGDHRLDPMYTRYDRRTLYVTYDVTAALQNGENCVGVLLGNGWYNFQSKAVWDFERAPWRNRPAFCLDIRITYTDGTTETISSNKSWKTNLSPVIYNSIYTGEHYDARKELNGWNRIGFNDKEWPNVMNRQTPSKNIVSQTLHPIRYTEAIKPKTITRKNDTTYVFDIGRNIAGVTAITLDGDSNTVVKVLHAERLGKDGFVDQSNVDYFLDKQTWGEDPFATDVYQLSGKGPQTFHPHFDYKGFQYVEVRSNKPIKLDQGSLVAYSMHSDVPTIGKIEASNDLLNKIYAATNASYLANLFGYPTDCPQREKNGWTGDAHIASETGLYNFDAQTIYEKWLNDARDEQQPNGVLPSIIPTGGWGYEWGNGPDWTSIIAIIPWNVYLFSGDSKILQDNYSSMVRYVDYITSIAPDGLTTWGLGDWIPVKSKTPVEFTSSVYYYVDVDIVAKTAKLLGKSSDHEKYKALANKIKNAINSKYLNTATGIYGSGYQTEQSVPLYWGIVPDALKTKVAQHLADSVKHNSYHLDVGILGAKSILGALSENGQAETAYQLAAQTTYPSWGWWIKNGATTLYENWNIDVQRDLSLNHIMFGEIGAWLFKAPGGINPDPANPGFKNVLLTPKFVKELDHFSAEHTGPYGTIVSSWKRNGAELVYEVTLPANTTADLKLGEKTVKIGSGKHRFVVNN